MRPRLKPVDLALTQFSVGIAALLLLFSPVLLIPALTEVAQAQTIQERKVEAERLLEKGEELLEREFTSALESYQQALKIYQEIKDSQGEIEALQLLSEAYFTQQQYPKAIEYAQKQLELARKIQDDEGEYEALLSLYDIYMEVTNYAKAIETAERMVALSLEGDILDALEFLAEAYAASGDQAKADELRQRVYSEKLDNYQQRLTRAREQRDQESEIKALAKLGHFYLRYKEFAKAVDYYEQGLKIARESRKQEVEINFLTALGKVHHQQGDSAKATDYFNQAFKIVQELNSQRLNSRFLRSLEDLAAIYLPKAEAERLRKQARQYRRRDEYESAIQIYQQALEIYRSIRDRNGEAGVLEDLGDAYRLQSNNDQGLQKNYDQEIDAYQQALKIYREIGNRQGEASVLFSLSSVYNRLQDLPKAIEYTEQELKVVRELRQSDESYSVDDEIGILVTLREFYEAQANYAKAIEVAQSWLSLAPQSEDANEERRALVALAKTYAVMGDTAKSAEYQSQIEQRQQSGINQSDENTLTAIERYQQQLAEARKRRDRRGEMNAHEALRKQYYSLGDNTRALSHAESGLQIAKEINNHEAVLEFARSTGRYYSYLSDWKKALASYRQGIEYHRQHPSSQGKRILSVNRIYSQQARPLIALTATY